MGIIIENYAGRFPLWLSPEQVLVLPVSEKYVDYAKRLRSDSERMVCVPIPIYVMIVSATKSVRRVCKNSLCYRSRRERNRSQSISVRSRDEGELGEMSFDEFLSRIETAHPKKAAPAA